MIRRRIDYKGRLIDTKVDIKSEAIAKVLIDINQDVTGLTLTKTPPVVRLVSKHVCNA